MSAAQKTSAPPVETEVLEIDPAHVMKREKHFARQHYEELARQAASQK